MKHLRTAALLLSLLSLASVVSCGDTAVNPDEQTEIATALVTEAVTEAGYPAPDTSNLDFKGDSLRIICPEWSTYTYYYTEDLDGEAVNDAAYTRLSNVQNELNVKIEWIWSTDAECHKTVKNAVTAGDDAYDIVFTHCIYGISDYATSHALYNLDDLPHLNFDAPWWSKTMIEDFRIGSETYYATGDINLASNSAVFFNKTIANDFDLPDHYEMVRQGKWTYDVFLSEAKKISVDLNGDGVINHEDQAGFTGDLTEALCNIPFACGENITKSTDSGLELVFYSEKMVEIFNKTYEYFLDPNVSLGYFRSMTDIRPYFGDNHALFTFSGINGMVALREYNIEFGVIPYPKYDEAQENYRTYAWPCFVCVPTTIERPEFVGASLEQFAYESTAVRDAYYEVLVRGKSTRDIESLEMLDIIANSLVCDIGPSYLGFDGQFHKAFYCFFELLSKKNNNISSHYESSKDAIQKVVDKLYEDVIAAQEA